MKKRRREESCFIFYQITGGNILLLVDFIFQFYYQFRLSAVMH